MIQIILAVLLKGMMRLPEPDFVMYKALLASLNDPDMDKNVKRALGKCSRGQVAFRKLN